MDAEDDDLSALRSAALASLSKKTQVHETREEDLTALRQAALMTRKQKQIEVIQSAVPQKTLLPNRIESRPPPLPVHIPLRGLLPPPRNVNVTVIRPLNMMPPAQFLQRPPTSFPLPHTQWGMNNLINLTPGPSPPVPPPLMGNLRGPRFINLPPRQYPPRSIAPQRGPINPNIIVPRQGNFSGPRNRPLREVRPAQLTVPKVQSLPPKSSTENVTEPKVPDKFSRYDPDSSSDDDEDDHTVATESQKDESDAESAVSDKSFSSVSEAADDGKPKGDKEEGAAGYSEGEDVENKSGNEASEAEADISVTNEDGILAAIDEFLDEGLDPQPTKKDTKKPPKTAPHTHKRKTDSPPNQLKKNQESQPIKRHPRIEFSQPDKATLPQKEAKQIRAKGIKPITGPGPVKTEKALNNTSEIVKTTSEKNFDQIPGVKMASKKESTEHSRTKPHKPSNLGADVAVRVERDSRNLDVPDHNVVARKATQVQNAARFKSQDFSARPRVEVSLPETRQRRDSDLDSVGSSDLSFLSSSESDAEPEKVPVNARKPNNQGVRAASKTELPHGRREGALVSSTQVKMRERVDLRASDRNTSSKVEKRRPVGGVKERIGVREKRDRGSPTVEERDGRRPEVKERPLEDSPVDLRKTQKSKRVDLRQKLKREMPENAEESQNPKSLDLRDKIKQRKNPSLANVEERAKSSSKGRKPSPVMTQSEQAPMATVKKSTIVKLNSNSKQRKFLSEGRNIVITRKRTPSPVSENNSPSPEPVRMSQNRERTPRTRKRSVSTRSMDVKGKQPLAGPERSAKAVTVKPGKPQRKNRDFLDSIGHDRPKVRGRKLSDKSVNKQQRSRQDAAPESSESEEEDDEVDILDIHEYDDMLFDAEGNFELEVPEKTTPKSRRRSGDVRPRPSTSSSSDGEIVEEAEFDMNFRNQNLRRQHSATQRTDQQRKPVEVDSDSDGEIIEEQPGPKVGKKTLPKRRISSAKRRKPAHMENFTINDSDNEIIEEEKPRYRKQEKAIKIMPDFRRQRDTIDEFEKRPPSRSKMDTSVKGRRVLISTKPIQDSKRGSTKRDLKRKSPVIEDSKPIKKSLKKRLGSRVVVRSDDFADEDFAQRRDSDSENDSRKSAKARKIVKTKHKKSLAKQDDRLEARIQRIKKQNGRILQRQMEIEHEKKAFG